MADLDQIRPIKQRVEAQLRKIPGVHAVGIGEKYAGGKPTGETAILVLVVKKRPLDQLQAGEVVPADIDGIKTDVIEVPVPKLLMAAFPGNLTRTIDDPHSFTFSGQDKPGAGLLVTVEFTATPTAASPPRFVVTYETSDDDTLKDIARNLAANFAGHAGLQGLTATSGGGTQVTVTPPTGGTLTISDVIITAIDDAQYFDKWVRGGIQLGLKPKIRGSGTLGCLATTAPTAQDPQGKVVAVTNHHVVEPDLTWGTNLVATSNPAIANQILFASNDGKPITPSTVFSVGIVTAAGEDEAIYLTTKGNTPADVANGAAAAVTALAMAGVTPTPSASTLTIAGATNFTFQVRGPLAPKEDFSGAVDRNSITYSGEVGNDDHGLFIDIHPGNAPSFGLFANPPKNSNSDGMATRVMEAFQKLQHDFPAVVGNVTMTQTGSTITISHAELIESRISDDIRVGQPDPSFGSSCCHCCSHRIGRVLAARLDLDVALIQLDPDLKYKPEVQDLGLVAGVEPPAQPMSVYKRGRTTQNTTLATAGIVRGTNLSGVVRGTLRLYNNAFFIQGVGVGPFTVPGDSGSAVVNFSSKVVGLLWGGDDIWAFATPIDLIIGAFPDLALNLAPAPAAGQAADAVRTVPKPAAHMQAAPESLAQATPPVMISRRLEDRLLEAEKEIGSVPAGREYANLIRRHFDEGQTLVNGNRRVATAWHRNGGPELLQAIFRIVQQPGQRLPLQLNGKPLAECLRTILDVMTRYASPRLSADLQQHAPRLAGLAGLSYIDVLVMLQSWSEKL